MLNQEETFLKRASKKTLISTLPPVKMQATLLFLNRPPFYFLAYFKSAAMTVAEEG